MTEISSQAETYFTAVTALRSDDPAARVLAIETLLELAFGPTSAIQRQAVIALEDTWPRLGVRIVRADELDQLDPSRLISECMLACMPGQVAVNNNEQYQCIMEVSCSRGKTPGGTHFWGSPDAVGYDSLWGCHRPTILQTLLVLTSKCW